MHLHYVILNPFSFCRGFIEMENLFLVLRFVPPTSVELIHTHNVMWRHVNHSFIVNEYVGILDKL